MTPIYPPSDPRSGWPACPPIPSETLPAADLLAHILEGNDETQPLSGRIERGNDLRAAVAALPGSRRRSLEREFGGRLESILALTVETNPENFFAALWEIGRSLETQEHFEAAGRIYITIVALNRHPECGAERRGLSERAQHRINFLSGHGTWQDYGDLFLRQSLDPVDLAAFGLAGVAARTVRFATLGRILQSQARFQASGLSPWWTRGSAPRIIAGWVGLNIEVPTFVFASRVGELAAGRNPDWNSGALDREIRDAYRLFLPVRGLMVAGSLFARSRMGILSLRAATRRQRFYHELAVQTGVLGGLTFSHLAQDRQEPNAETAASVESLADGARVYFQFNAMRLPAALFLRPRIGR